MLDLTKLDLKIKAVFHLKENEGNEKKIGREIIFVAWLRETKKEKKGEDNE